MSPTHVVVDGSNIATEGRSLPSLAQLDDAVRQFQDEFPDAETIVVVDATFGHRIDPSERPAFEAAVAHGELVSPPAGAIGRGDAFVLRIAERVDGQVLSNDSFQEFHAEHPWLFDEGRLVGGKPVTGVGWIFTPRLPVRGPRSRAGSARGAPRGASSAAGDGQPRPRRRGGRAALLEAVEAAAAEATEAATAPAAPDGATGSVDGTAAKRKRPRRRRRRKAGDPAVAAAIEAATQEAIGTEEGGPPRSGRSKAAPGPQAVNDPLSFIHFISDHPIGDRVTGTVSNFVSHGAMVDVGDFCCYVPLSGLGSPAPKSARAVLHKGETRTFVVAALDPPRRGVQLAVPEVYAEAAGAEGPSAASDATSPEAVKKAGRRTATAATTAKVSKAAKSAETAKAAKATKQAKAAKATKPAKAAKAAAKAAKVSAPPGTARTAKTSGATTATRASKTTAAKTAKTAKAAKAAKTAKATKATPAAKSAKTAKAAKAAKATKAGKTPAAGTRAIKAVGVTKVAEGARAAKAARVTKAAGGGARGGRRRR